jgi:chromosome segregation ATPase
MKLEKSISDMKAAQVRSLDVTGFNKQLMQLQETSAKQIEDMRKQLEQYQKSNTQLQDQKKTIENELTQLKQSSASQQKQQGEAVPKLENEIADLKKKVGTAEQDKARVEGEKKSLQVRLMAWSDGPFPYFLTSYVLGIRLKCKL